MPTDCGYNEEFYRTAWCRWLGRWITDGPIDWRGRVYWLGVWLYGKMHVMETWPDSPHEKATIRYSPTLREVVFGFKGDKS